MRKIAIVLVLLFATSAVYAETLESQLQTLITVCETVKTMDSNTAVASVFKDTMAPHFATMGEIWITQIGDSLYMLMESPGFALLTKEKMEEILPGLQESMESFDGVEGISGSMTIVRNTGKSLPRATVTATEVNVWK